MTRISILPFMISLSFLSVQSFGQSCACPEVCKPCKGDLVSLTIQYNGTGNHLITIKDKNKVIEIFDNVQHGDILTFSGQKKDKKFEDKNIKVYVDGILNATIEVNCKKLTLDPDELIGDFYVLAVESKDNGPVCCTDPEVDLPPMITGCPADIVMDYTSTTPCKALVSWTAPVANDCNLKSFTTSTPPPHTFPVGTTTVTYTAKDEGNNTTTCSFKVTVVDRKPPFISACPTDIMLDIENGCKAKATWTPPVFTDDCSGVTVTSTHKPGDEFPSGKTTVTYTARDGKQNISTCTFTINVQDQLDPQLTDCPDNINLYTADNERPASWMPPIATDECELESLTSTHSPGDDFPLGSTQVTYTAVDKSGHTSSCSFVVNIMTQDHLLTIGKIVMPDKGGPTDRWVIGNIEHFDECKVVIVDRWGSTVYKADHYDNQNTVWSGQDFKGGQLPTGTYFYSVSVLTGDTWTESKGFVELVR